MITGLEFAENALLPKWNKFTYSQLDCQGFVEAVLKDIGVRKPNGQAYNWTGSNSMYRNYYSWRGSIEACKDKFGFIPVGAFIYIHKNTDIPEQYKKDGLGNFSHVAIYCGKDIVRDSTRSTKTKRDGVGTRTLEGFTHVSLFTGLDYSFINKYNASVEKALQMLDGIRNQLIDLEGVINGLRES